ncbi:methyltransferase domain-containing protein [Haloplanus aerogenes]|uniref:Methyltransferase domain-containing protein n=1 Tax=Haloplanus aerogenes TaxID=660522 RepID=A0A3M0DQD8_9EURY|nr:methyltransferase domain-containing protein [Haloplanus aerogenes]AZH24587.1 methyltransferase domain-containing protein [Haloplanus aerogenes]RMB23755.1 methyltransferase family protein [Haloplanus aerogenes]
MRRFSADYLRRTRDGLWSSREALAPLDLPSRDRVLDVGCGTGELTRVLASEAGDGCEVIGVDADPSLLRVAREETDLPVVAGDALRLPVRDDAADLVTCQALLVNLPDPTAALREFRRVASEAVAAVEPDNADVAVESTIDREVDLERRVREAFLDGVATDVAPGERIVEAFEAAGLVDVRTRRHYHRKVIEPPYDEGDLRDATRKATGAGLADHETELRRAVGTAYDDLRAAWREMGREVIDAMQDGTYRRAEVVPFDVVIGRVPAG